MTGVETYPAGFDLDWMIAQASTSSNTGFNHCATCDAKSTAVLALYESLKRTQVLGRTQLDAINRRADGRIAG